MENKEVLDELKTILVERLKFDPRRAADTGFETALPKGLDGSLGLDSLDFIEMSIAIEERFGLVAGAEAVEDAGLSRAELARTALVVGAVGGGMLETEAWYWARARGHGEPAAGAGLAAVLPCSHADVIGRRLGLGGPRETVV